MPENVVRGLLKIGGRTIVGRIRAAGPEGIEVQTLETPTMGEGTFRCLGAPGELPVIWTAFVTRVEGGALVAWPDEDLAESQWPRLRSMLGLPGGARHPTRRTELPSQPSGIRTPAPATPRAPRLPAVSTPPGAPRAPSSSGERSPFTTDTLQAARGRGLVEPPRSRAQVVHLPARPVANALARSLSDLSPMIEIDGAPALRPRDVFVARIPVQGTSVLLEATVVTVRGGRARVRLSIPSAGVRALLEAGA